MHALLCIIHCSACCCIINTCYLCSQVFLIEYMLERLTPEVIETIGREYEDFLLCVFILCLVFSFWIHDNFLCSQESRQQQRQQQQEQPIITSPRGRRSRSRSPSRSRSRSRSLHSAHRQILHRDVILPVPTFIENIMPYGVVVLLLCIENIMMCAVLSCRHERYSSRRTTTTPSKRCPEHSSELLVVAAMEI